MMRLTLVWWCAAALVGACVSESDPEAAGTDDGSGQDDQEECDEALDDPPQCEFPLGVQYQAGDAVADATVVDLDTSEVIVELEDAVFVPPSAGPQLVGFPAVANDVCILGCFVGVPASQGSCIVYADDGTVKCMSPAGDVAGCESFAEACRS